MAMEPNFKDITQDGTCCIVSCEEKASLRVQFDIPKRPPSDKWRELCAYHFDKYHNFILSSDSLA